MARFIEDIEHFSEEIGARPSGTEEEQQAGLFFAESMKRETGFPTVIEDFNVASNPDTVKLICFAVALVCGLVSILVPVLTLPAFLVSLAASILFALEIFDKPVLSRFLRSGVSQNVVVKYQPAGVSARNRKIVLVANYDSGKANIDQKGLIGSKLNIIKWVTFGGLVAMPFLLFIQGVIFPSASGPVDAVFTCLTLVSMIIVAVPLVNAVLHQVAPYNQGANNNASSIAVLMDVARQVSAGTVTLDEMAARAEQDEVQVHGEAAAIEAGVIPEGAEVEYEADPQEQKPREQKLTPEESLAAAKAAIAALTGRPVADKVPIASISGRLVNGSSAFDPSTSEVRFEEEDPNEHSYVPAQEADIQEVVQLDESGEVLEGVAEVEESESAAPVEPVSAYRPTEFNFTRSVPDALQSGSRAGSSTDRTPAWARTAQAKARANKPEQAEAIPAHRSRYADTPAAQLTNMRSAPVGGFVPVPVAVPAAAVPAAAVPAPTVETPEVLLGAEKPATDDKSMPVISGNVVDEAAVQAAAAEDKPAVPTTSTTPAVNFWGASAQQQPATGIDPSISERLAAFRAEVQNAQIPHLSDEAREAFSHMDDPQPKKVSRRAAAREAAREAELAEQAAAEAEANVAAAEAGASAAEQIDVVEPATDGSSLAEPETVVDNSNEVTGAMSPVAKVAAAVPAISDFFSSLADKKEHHAASPKQDEFVEPAQQEESVVASASQVASVADATRENEVELSESAVESTLSEGEEPVVEELSEEEPQTAHSLRSRRSTRVSQPQGKLDGFRNRFQQIAENMTAAASEAAAQFKHEETPVEEPEPIVAADLEPVEDDAAFAELEPTTAFDALADAPVVSVEKDSVAEAAPKEEPSFDKGARLEAPAAPAVSEVTKAEEASSAASSVIEKLEEAASAGEPIAANAIPRPVASMEAVDVSRFMNKPSEPEVPTAEKSTQPVSMEQIKAAMRAAVEQNQAAEKASSAEIAASEEAPAKASAAASGTEAPQSAKPQQASPIVGLDSGAIPRIELDEKPVAAHRVISLPELEESPVAAAKDLKQRAPMSLDAGISPLVSSMLPRIDSDQPVDRFGLNLPELGAEPEVSNNTVSMTSSFATAAISSPFAPVGDELIADVAPDEIYLEDADDSSFEENHTEMGAFAGPEYVELPKSRVGRLFGRFGKKKKAEESSVTEWVGADESYTASSAGAERGDWSSFRSDDDDEKWNGGAFSLARLREAGGNALSGVKDKASGSLSHRRVKRAEEELPVEEENYEVLYSGDAPLDEPENQRVMELNEELAKINDFRHPDINTEVWFVALGSELANNGGMKAFLEEHAAELQGSVIVNLEGVGAGKLTYLESEGLYRPAKPSSRVKRYLRAASERSGVRVATGKMNSHDTAATLATRRGFQAFTIAGMQDGKVAYFSDKADTVDCLDVEALRDASDFVMGLIKSI